MADERAYLYRNTGTKASPVWEKWYPRTMADAVETADGRTVEDYIDNIGVLAKLSEGGSSNNHIALANAIEEANAKNTFVRIPAGDYVFTESITIPEEYNVKIVGVCDSYSVSREDVGDEKHPVHRGSCLIYRGTDKFFVNGGDVILSLENLMLLNERSDKTYMQTGRVLGQSTVDHSAKGKIYIRNCCIAGWRYSFGNAETNEYCCVLVNRTRWSYCLSAIDNNVDGRVLDCSVNKCTNGMRFDGDSGFTTISNTRIEWCTEAGILLDSNGAHDITISGCEFDRCGKPAIVANGGKRITISGNMFRRNGAGMEKGYHIQLENVAGAILANNNTRYMEVLDTSGEHPKKPELSYKIYNCEDVIMRGNNWNGCETPQEDVGSELSQVGITGAVGDGETDDTDALTQALNQNNAVVDGGNKKYKYLALNLEGVENLTIRNIVFWKGQQVNLKGCHNVRFEHCRWEGINCNDMDIATYGVELTTRTKGDGTTRCEDITFEGCVFKDIWYNEKFSVPNDCAHYTTGQGIRPSSVHKLFVHHCFFTQTKGNAAIHWNSYEPGNGYFEITDNLFYLTGWGGVCMFATQNEFDRMISKVSNNHFIGCGLGNIPDEYMNKLDASIRGVGCAAMLGGYLSQYTPYKPHAICENNVFEDNVESSIEGPAWNPINGNYINGQGALQDEANCKLLKEKYHLDYDLHVRYNPSVNMIYRGQEVNSDGSTVFEEYDPMVITSNVFGKAYVDLDGFIMFTGDFGSPVVLTNNVLSIEEKNTGHLYSHFFQCHFRRGLRIEGNQGIRSYLNQCTIEGDLVLDDFLSQWSTDFSGCNLIAKGKNRFPETLVTTYDPTSVLLDNAQATVDDGIVTLTAYDVPEQTTEPTDTVYDIRNASGYTEENGVTFPGPSAPTHIDTGVQLLKDNGDFTIYLEFEGNPTTDIPKEGSGIMALFKVYNATDSSSRMSVGGLWQNFNTSMNETSAVWYSKDLDATQGYTLKNLKMLVRRKDSTVEFWLAYRADDADSLTTHKVLTYEITNEVAWTDYEGTLLIGSEDGYKGEDNAYALWGKMYDFRVYSRAVSDTEVGALLYHKLISTDSSPTEEPTVAYDLSTDSHYSTEDECVTFDGTFGIDTGIELFADDSDFTALVQFELEDYKDAGLTNFSFIPVLSSMNYTEDTESATNWKSPGFDLGLSMQDGESLETVATGGFVNIRNSWKFSNCTSIDPSNYFDYYTRRYGVIFIRKSRVITVYDFNMQQLATISGADATTVFSGTLRIGENMVSPTLAGNHKLKGKVYECKVYREALSTAYLEQQYPNIYSNERRIKGCARYLVRNPTDSTQLVRKLLLDLSVDMGDYGSPEYTGKYPNAIGIKVENVSDVYWLGTGTNGKLHLWLDGKQEIKPFGKIAVDVVNAGLCPGLTATVQRLHCTLLTEVQASVAATDLTIAWDGEVDSIAVGQTLTGRITWLPDGANTETILWVRIEGDAVAVRYANGIFTAQGKSEGSTTMTCKMLCGTEKTVTFTVV